MFLAYASAREFASSLRVAQQIHPDNPRLDIMVAGELDTDNLRFAGYEKRGDHADFLQHFLPTLSPTTIDRLERYAAQYVSACLGLSDESRAMSVFSREQELPGIFERILTAKQWNADGLPAFKYYLEKHVSLDSGANGHAKLTAEFAIDDSIQDFYEARLEMYRAIPSLFNTER